MISRLRTLHHTCFFGPSGAGCQQQRGRLSSNTARFNVIRPGLGPNKSTYVVLCLSSGIQDTRYLAVTATLSHWENHNLRPSCLLLYSCHDRSFILHLHRSRRWESIGPWKQRCLTLGMLPRTRPRDNTLSPLRHTQDGERPDI
jgi:hypothetical protein